MDEDENIYRKSLPSLPKNALSASVKSRQVDYLARLSMSEAVAAVSRMVAVYPNPGSAGKAYIGAMAALLMKYPKQLALDCANPLSGVALESEFTPTLAKATAWLERYMYPFDKAQAWDRRTAEQFTERDYQKPEPLEKRKEVAERIIKQVADAFTRNAGNSFSAKHGRPNGPFETEASKFNPNKRQLPYG